MGIFSKRELEGYLEIDHRESEGLSPKVAEKAGLGGLPIGRNSFFQTPTVSCSHCQAQVILNPDRSRPRGYCPKCDHYICDRCGAVAAATVTPRAELRLWAPCWRHPLRIRMTAADLEPEAATSPVSRR